jgi:hypothetical protein
MRPARVGRVGVIGHPVAKTAVVAKAVTPGPSPIAKTAVVAAAVTPGRPRRIRRSRSPPLPVLPLRAKLEVNTRSKAAARRRNLSQPSSGRHDAAESPARSDVAGCGERDDRWRCSHLPKRMLILEPALVAEQHPELPDRPASRRPTRSSPK